MKQIVKTLQDRLTFQVWRSYKVRTLVEWLYCNNMIQFAEQPVVHKTPLVSNFKHLQGDYLLDILKYFTTTQFISNVSLSGMLRNMFGVLID